MPVTLRSLKHAALASLENVVHAVFSVLFKVAAKGKFCMHISFHIVLHMRLMTDHGPCMNSTPN